jgi:5-methyltetrahydrofolate--homocysteine methyltransferase
MKTTGEKRPEELLRDLAQALIEGDKDRCEDLTHELLSGGLSGKEILDRGLVPGMDVVGERFRDNLIYLPEVLVSARAMKASLSILEPFLSAAEASGRGTCVLGTVKGDIHDIGKNIVGIMLRGAGFRVVDLGVNTPADKFLEAAEKEKADLVGMSALLTTTMGYMKVVVEEIKSNGLGVKTLVGGAPLSQSFADEIGADGYAKNAVEAVQRAKALLAIE